MPPLLAMQGIGKQYPGVTALSDVSFELLAGEVHCLVGENGAGKSTLIAILSGAVRRDAGEIFIDGRPATVTSPMQSRRLGIGVIHQDFKLVPELTVAENILLGSEPVRGPLRLINRAEMHRRAEAALAQLGESIPVNRRVADLSTAQCQIIEIAKACAENVRILAMDEPSAALTDRELKNLFAVIHRLKTEGTGIIYISHRLEEISDIGDRVTVLRDGRRVHTCSVGEAGRSAIVRWMVGREMDRETPCIARQTGEEILRVCGLTAGFVKDVSFTLHRGEILGFSGLLGSGRSEVARLIFGADRRERGTLILDGREIDPASPRDAIDLGIGLLTEDRNRFGLIMERSIRENISLSNLRALMRGPFIDRVRERDAAVRSASDLRIKTPGVEQSVSTLSGGNRQKVILARWLFTRSNVLIFDEPTAGIDVGVKYEITSLMNRLAAQGIGIIVISSDLPELLGVSDRIAVMHEGRLMGIIPREQATQEAVMTLATGGSPGIGHAA